MNNQITKWFKYTCMHMCINVICYSKTYDISHDHVEMLVLNIFHIVYDSADQMNHYSLLMLSEFPFIINFVMLIYSIL